MEIKGSQEKKTIKCSDVSKLTDPEAAEISGVTLPALYSLSSEVLKVDKLETLTDFKNKSEHHSTYNYKIIIQLLIMSLFFLRFQCRAKA